MRLWNLIRHIAPIAALLSLGTGTASAATCLENRDFYQSLPTIIGKEDQVGKLPFALNCDTVFVRKGVTTVVYPGSMLYFAKPTLNSVIKVEGTLLIKGTKNSYVSLSGSLDSSRTGIEAGNRQWGGIEVAEGGKLEIEFAGFMRAPTPITAFSRQVILLNTWFKGSSGIILPDGSLYPLESTWHAINSLNLAKSTTDKGAEPERPADAISEKEKADLLGNQGSFWTWKKVAGGAAALAVVGIGAGIYLTPDKAPAKAPVPPGGGGTPISGIDDPPPAFPGVK